MASKKTKAVSQRDQIFQALALSPNTGTANVAKQFLNGTFSELALKKLSNEFFAFILDGKIAEAIELGGDDNAEILKKFLPADKK